MACSLGRGLSIAFCLSVCHRNRVAIAISYSYGREFLLSNAAEKSKYRRKKCQKSLKLSLIAQAYAETFHCFDIFVILVL